MKYQLINTIVRALVCAISLVFCNSCLVEKSPSQPLKTTSGNSRNKIENSNNGNRNGMVAFSRKLTNLDSKAPRLFITYSAEKGYLFRRSLPLTGISVDITINRWAENNLVIGPNYYWRYIVGSSHRFEFREFDYGRFLFVNRMPAPKDGFMEYRQLVPKDNVAPPILPSDMKMIVCFDTMEQGSISSYSEAWSFELPNQGETVNATLESKSIERQKREKHQESAWEFK